MPRLGLKLAYQGTHYAGWQLQAKSGGVELPTIQGALERAVGRITGTRIPVHGAGRTDAGVHAEAQVCHLDIEEKHSDVDWIKALNINLPEDIRVIDAVLTDTGFHARKSATGKRYAYSVWMHKSKALPRVAPFVWSIPAIAPEALAVAQSIIPAISGTRDFASFQNSGTRLKNTVRTVHSISFHPGLVGVLTCPASWPVATIIVEGDGFLKQMVRNIVGLLVWTAQGKVAPDDVPAIVAAGRRNALPSPSAPAGGLTLLEVMYDQLPPPLGHP